MTVETAMEAPDISLGTFLVNSHPATVLFDTGASNSFITQAFVDKHNLPTSTRVKSYLIKSPGGELRSNKVCRGVSINIRGVAFHTPLIVLESPGIDVILRMDTLEKWGSL